MPYPMRLYQKLSFAIAVPMMVRVNWYDCEIFQTTPNCSPLRIRYAHASGCAAQGTVGQLMTRGLLERFVKHHPGSEQKKRKAMEWLANIRG